MHPAAPTVRKWFTQPVKFSTFIFRLLLHLIVNHGIWTPTFRQASHIYVFNCILSDSKLTTAETNLKATWTRHITDRTHCHTETANCHTPATHTCHGTAASPKNTMFASIFQCDLPTVTCELQDSTEEQVKRKRRRHLEPSVTLLAQIGNDSTLKRRRPKPSRTRAKLFSATEPPFARKNTMFHANPNILKTKKAKRKKKHKKNGDQKNWEKLCSCLCVLSPSAYRQVALNPVKAECRRNGTILSHPSSSNGGLKGWLKGWLKGVTKVPSLPPRKSEALRGLKRGLRRCLRGGLRGGLREGLRGGLRGAFRGTLREGFKGDLKGARKKNETKGLKGVIKESLKAGPQ